MKHFPRLKPVFFALTFLSVILQLNSQEGEPPEIFPESPTTAELGKYGSYPVNLSTGLPNIEFNLYTIELGDIKIPINLKYHASGIKVKQQNSWVGLGWSLDTGGLISLETRDTPDQLEPFIYDIPDEQDILDFFYQNPFGYGDDYFDDYLKKYSWVKDAYHINLPTVSGTFFLDSNLNGEVGTKLPPDKFKVEKGCNLPNCLFKITDKQGMKYSFSDYEESEIKRIGYTGPLHIYNKKYKSAWLLTKVEDTKGNSLQYTYGNQYGVFSSGQSHSKNISYTTVEDQSQGSGHQTFSSYNHPMQVSESQSWSYTKKLSEINFTNGRIRFVLGSHPQYDGVHSEDGIYLDEIIVESKDHLGLFSVVKRFKFFYTTIGNPTPYPSSIDKYRFALDRIVEVSPEVNKEIASFEYNTAVTLPSYNSHNIDYFGYSNGKSNGNLIAKRHIAFKTTKFDQDIIEIGSADRSLDGENMKAGILTKITYPTKGYTSFDYEPNSYFGVNPFQLEDYESFSMHVVGEGNTINPPVPNPEDDGAKHEYYTFYTPESTKLYIESIFTHNEPPGGTRYGYADYTVYVNGNQVKNVRFSNYSNGTTIQNQITVGPGNITIDLAVFGTGLTGHLNNMYEVQYDNSNQNIEGFGLRVKSITNFDHDNSFIGKKSYEYLVPGSNTSSGKLLMNDSQYDMVSSFSSYNVENVSSTTGGCLTKTTQNTTHTYSSSSRQGYENANVAYEYVTEYDLDSLDNNLGRSEYKFTSDPNYIVDDNKTGSLWINYQSKRSKLLEKLIFDNDNKVLTKEENLYSEEPLVMNYRSDFKLYCNHHATVIWGGPGTLACGDTPEGYRLENTTSRFRTHLGLNWHKKDTTKLTNYFYDPNGTLSGQVLTTTDYTYNNLNQEIQKVTATNSDGEVMETSYKYAHDLGDNQLISENRISGPLETKIMEDNNIVGHSKTDYTFFNGTFYLPEIIYHNKGGLVDVNNSKHKVYTIDSYENGKIKEYHLENGINNSVIWGYNKEYPIAKIENANYSQFSGLVGNIQTLSNQDDSEADENALRASLENLRGSLPNAMVTTYTYDPLIGVTSMTDPKGYTIYYEYDDLHRLKQVKDADGNILSTNEYNYKQ